MFLSSIISKLKKSNKYTVLLFGITSLWTLSYLILAFAKFDGFYSGFRDLGIYDQALWNFVHGNGFKSSLEFLENAKGNLLAQHAELILFLFTPIYFIFANPKILIFFQVVGIFSSAIPLYFVSKETVQSKIIPLIIAVSFLLYAPIGWAALFEFSPGNFIVPFMLWGYYFLKSGRVKLFYLTILLALMTKEIVSAVLILYGLVIMFKTENKRVGKNILLISSIYAIFLFIFLLPFLNNGKSHPLLSYFSDTPITYSDLFKKTVSIEGVHSLFQQQNIRLFLQTFIPTGFIVFLEPVWLIPLLPQLGLQFLAIKPEMKLINFHYSSIATVFIFLALIYSLKRIQNRKQLLTIAILLLIVTSFSTNFWYGPSLLSRHLETPPYLPESESNKISGVLKTIPNFAAITTTQRIGSHLSQRKDIFIFPNGIETSEYIVLDTINFKQRPWLIAVFQENREDVLKASAKLLNNQKYEVKYKDEDLIIFKRK
jgi:uncharacterized membrane protein